MKLSKRTVLEFVGEFLATFILAIVILTSPIFAGGISPFVVAFAVMALWYMFSSISKTHMNPVISLGEYLVVLVRQFANKKFYVQDLVRFLVYIVVQFLAFLAAFPLVNWMQGEYAKYYIVKNQYGLTADIIKQVLASMPITTSYLADYSALAFVIEMVITFMVVFAFLKISTSEKFKQYTGLVFGLMVFVAMIIAVQTTGASFNPWRSLVPAIFDSGTALSQVGLYILAPVCGSVLAAVFYVLLKWLETPGKVVKKVVKKKGKK